MQLYPHAMLENTNAIHWPFHECTNDEFNKETCTEHYNQFSCYIFI